MVIVARRCEVLLALVIIIKGVVLCIVKSTGPKQTRLTRLVTDLENEQNGLTSLNHPFLVLALRRALRAVGSEANSPSLPFSLSLSYSFLLQLQLLAIALLMSPPPPKSFLPEPLIFPTVVSTPKTSSPRPATLNSPTPPIHASPVCSLLFSSPSNPPKSMSPPTDQPLTCFVSFAFPFR